MMIKTKLLFGLLLLAGCDLNHERKCEWYLVPEPKNADKADAGYIPVCARNYTTNKQNCLLQAKFDFVKENFERKFRLVDMDVDEEGRFPRKVKSIKYCD